MRKEDEFFYDPRTGRVAGEKPEIASDDTVRKLESMARDTGYWPWPLILTVINRLRKVERQLEKDRHERH